MDKTKVTAEGTTLVLKRVFQAPPEKVWEAWSNPEHFIKWWGPRGWETTVKSADFSAGGSMLYIMKCMDENQGEWFGKEACGKMEFESVNPPYDFTYTDYFCDSDGNIDESLPASKTTLTLESVGEGTKLVSKTNYASEADLKTVLDMGMEQGIKETWDRLDEVLAA